MKLTALFRMISLALCLVLLPFRASLGGEDTLQVSEYSSIARLRQAGLRKAREAEEEGIVLLRNEGNTLPLGTGARVALFGVTSVDPVYGGTGSGQVQTSSAPDFAEAFEEAGLTVTDTSLLSWYRSQLEEENIGRTRYAMGEAHWKQVRRHLGDENSEIRSSAAVVVLGRVGGEGDDMTHGAMKEDAARDGTDYLRLNPQEEELLRELASCKASGVISSITVIINSANPISAAFLFDDAYAVDAALWVGSLGQSGISAVGRVLTGEVNPSGCLPDTWWMDHTENPVMNNFGAQPYEGAEDFFPDRSYFEYTRYVVYQEGIYLGYRYTETRFEDVCTGRDGAGSFDYGSSVAFPFGYGLSYTSFSLSDMQVKREGSVYQVSIRVTNTGARSGKKTVQVYAAKPYTSLSADRGIEKASVELAGFGKTDLLASGESQDLTIGIPEYFLTSYDAQSTEVFILDEGVHSLIAAENAHDAVLRRLHAMPETSSAAPSPSPLDPLVWSFFQTYDDRTYAVSYGTGAPVASLFSYADINLYDGAEDNAVTWYARSSWDSTVTEGPVHLKMTKLMASDLVLTDDDLPDEDEEFPLMSSDAGLMLLDLKDCSFDDSAWDTFLNQLTFEELELLCMTGLRQTAALDRVGKPQTLDHNGPTGVTQPYGAHPEGNGLAVRTGDPDAGLSGTCYPCSGILAATFNIPLVEEVGRLIGEDAIWAGYAGIYGPGLNLHRCACAGRMFEYFSEDSILSGLMGAAWSRGVQSKNVYVYSKHLALNEQEENRAGLGTWCNEQALRELYLRPFELAIVHGGARCAMSAFNRLGPIWCGASSALLTDWLRTEVGMAGFVVTDMYDDTYMDPANFLAAGNDLPDGELLRSRLTLSMYTEEGESPNPSVIRALRLSAKRILYTVLHSRAMDGYGAR